MGRRQRGGKMTKLIFLIAFLITFGLSLSLNIVSNADAGITKNMSPIVKFIIRIEKSIKVDTLKSIIAFSLIFYHQVHS